MLRRIRMLLFFVLICLQPFYVMAVELKDYVCIVKPSLHEETKETFYKIADFFDDKNSTSLANIFRSFADGGHGSGFILQTESGRYVITNRHVVRHGASIDLLFEQEDGSQRVIHNASIKYIDTLLDLALIEIPDQELISQTGIEVYKGVISDGDAVFSVGFPGLLGRPGWQFATGNITNKKAWVPEMVDPEISYVIQHSATIDPGNSGGPLLVKDETTEMGYKVIGINTWSIIDRQNTFFSIPAVTLNEFLKRAEIVEEIKNDNSRRKDELIKMCKMFTSELNSENPDNNKVRDFISYKFVGKSGWESFIELLKKSDKETALQWEYSFFNDSPIETMRSAIFIRFRNTLLRLKDRDIHYIGINYSDDMDFDEKTSVRTEFSLNNEPIEIRWIFEFGRWRIEYMDFNRIKTSNSEELIYYEKDEHKSSDLSPYINLAIPGYHQISKGDLPEGLGFAVVAAAGIGLFLYSEIMYSQNWSSYNQATSPADSVDYYDAASRNRLTSIIGVSLWIGSAIFSTIFAHGK